MVFLLILMEALQLIILFKMAFRLFPWGLSVLLHRDFCLFMDIYGQYNNLKWPFSWPFSSFRSLSVPFMNLSLPFSSFHCLSLPFGAFQCLATPSFPPAHWWLLILLINDFSLVIGGKLHSESEYLCFSLLVANYPIE